MHQTPPQRPMLSSHGFQRDPFNRSHPLNPGFPLESNIQPGFVGINNSVRDLSSYPYRLLVSESRTANQPHNTTRRSNSPTLARNRLSRGSSEVVAVTHVTRSSGASGGDRFKLWLKSMNRSYAIDTIDIIIHAHVMYPSTYI